MSTLHIEHAITDYAVWKQAFDRFAPRRAAAGVRAHVVRQPVDDPAYVVVDLDFDTPDEATDFLAFLRSQVWSTPTSSPALVGEPLTRVLVTTESAGAQDAR